jgi:hypothetical protein
MSTYHVARGVRWSVGRTNLTVANGRGHVQALEYPEAAVWDLLTRGYRFDDVVRLTGHITSTSSADAAVLVRSSLQRWCDAGLVEER